MQISDLVGQYNNSTGKPQVTGTTGTKKLASTLREMKNGSIFEGTVNSVKNGQVVLGLSNGQTVTARLDGKVALTIGQSMFFQVKENDGGTIAIRPYTVGGNSMNLTLMDALKAGNLPIDERNLAMVNAMMEEQMPIDRGSVNQMAKLLLANPQVDVKTIVSMQKLDIPITPENTSQFQNYLMDKQAIGRALDDFIMELPKSLVSENLSGMQMQEIGSKVLAVVTEGLSEQVDIPTEATYQAQVSLTKEEMQLLGVSDEALLTPADEAIEASEEQVSSKEVAQGLAMVDEEGNPVIDRAQMGESVLENHAINQNSYNDIPNTLGNVLTREQIHHLEQMVSDILPKTEEGEPITLDLSGTDSTVSVLNTLAERLSSKEPLDKTTLTKLFLSNEFQTLVKDALEQQWLIHPEDLKDSGKINRLYEKLESQLERMEQVVKASGQESDSVTQLAQEIRSNVEFMNQINEAYTYVQIPLKLSGQNASGELYVYTNKKALKEGTEDLSAFLHLDMEHLGSTDVSVKLHGKQVDTKFYFDNDESYQLVEANLDKLDARLKAKGYNCNFTVVNEGKHVNFVEDFLKKDQPSAGLVHRYSFDVRA